MKKRILDVLHQEKCLQEILLTYETDYCHTISSKLGNHRSSTLICNKRETGKNVFLGQVRKIIQKFLVGHSGRKIIQHIINSNPQTTNAGFTTSFTRFNCYNFCIIYHRLQKFHIFTSVNSNVFQFTCPQGANP